MSREFPDDILDELVDYTKSVFNEQLSYSFSNLDNALSDGHVTKWEVFEQAMYTAKKEGDIYMTKLCLDSLSCDADRKHFIEIHNYDICSLVKNNHCDLLNYYLENQYFEITAEFIKDYDTYRKYLGDTKGNVAYSVIETYLLNFSLDKVLETKPEKTNKNKL